MSAMTTAAAAQNPNLRSPGGSKVFEPKSRFGPVGVAVMVGAHVFIGYALVTGLAGKAIAIIKKPLNATIIQEVQLPPPPPPPPPPKQIVKHEVPKVQTPPPPAYVPPPEVTPPAAPPAPSIAAVQSAEPAAPPPAAPPAPLAPPAPAGPVRTEIALVCPRQVKPEIPGRAIDDGIEGTVKAEVHVRGGKVVEVRILSGPRVFHAAVRAAISRYECSSSGDAELVAVQDFTFKLD